MYLEMFDSEIRNLFVNNVVADITSSLKILSWKRGSRAISFSFECKHFV